MSINRFARRYAKAFVEQAKKENMLEHIKTDTDLLLEMINSNRDFFLFLRSPIILREKKLKILNKILEGKVSGNTVNFIKLIAENGREGYTKNILLEVKDFFRKQDGIVPAKITTVSAIDDIQKEQIIDYVKKATNSKDVELEMCLKNDIIGGFALQFEDKLLDATVASKLKNMKLIIS